MKDQFGTELEVGDIIEHCQGIRGKVIWARPLSPVIVLGDDGQDYMFGVSTYLTLIARPSNIDPGHWHSQPFDGGQAIEADTNPPHVMGLDPEVIDPAAYRAFMRDLQT